jgi:hypothetical protein
MPSSQLAVACSHHHSGFHEDLPEPEPSALERKADAFAPPVAPIQARGHFPQQQQPQQQQYQRAGSATMMPQQPPGPMQLQQGYPGPYPQQQPEQPAPRLSCCAQVWVWLLLLLSASFVILAEFSVGTYLPSAMLAGAGSLG